MARNATTLTATGQLLRTGWSDFTTDGSFDAGTMTSHVMTSDAPPSGAFPRHHTKVVSGVFTEMTQAEKDVVDANLLATDIAMKKSQVKANLLNGALGDLVALKSTSGLTITININSLVVGQEIDVTADPSDTKYVQVCYVYNATTDDFGIESYEKTTGEYSELEDDETLVKCVGEWSVPANGTTLTEVM